MDQVDAELREAALIVSCSEMRAEIHEFAKHYHPMFESFGMSLAQSYQLFQLMQIKEGIVTINETLMEIFPEETK